jgi:hypothetical protein
VYKNKNIKKETKKELASRILELAQKPENLRKKYERMKKVELENIVKNLVQFGNCFVSVEFLYIPNTI